jgi:AraC-like DNA-binding protein/mannose-6-phosphate isomerase-like protein (cupin superfamily)
MSNDNCTFSVRIGNDTLTIRVSDKEHSYRYRWNSQRHCNAEYELHIILWGSCQVEVEDVHTELKEKQAILIAPGQYHRPQTTSEEFERFTLAFSVTKGDFLATLRSQISSYCVFDIDKVMERACRNMFYEGTAKNPNSREMLEALLTQLMICVKRRLDIVEEQRSEKESSRERSRIDLIDNYFEENFANHAGRAVLAQMLNMSERQLHRVLLDIYGMGFQQKLINARMDHAAWMLRNTNKQVGEIASSVGYSSEAAFFQVFRNHFQLTPQQYRIRVKQDR